MLPLIHDFLRDAAARSPEKIALICGERRYRYRELDETADRLAAALRERGVRRGDRVAIYLPNSMEAVVGLFAALKAGGVFVALGRGTKPEKLLSVLNDCGAKALITDGRALSQMPGALLVERVPSLRTIVACGAAAPADGWAYLRFSETSAAGPGAALPRENIDLDLACLIYTSGTTGESKGVMCDHGSMAFVAGAIAQYLKHTPADVVLSVLPLAYSYGLYQLLATFYVGGTLVLEESFAFPDVVLRRMQEERVTGFAGVPTIYSMLLTMDLSALDLSALRYLTNAAAGLPVEHVRRLREAFPRVELYLMHGLTEVARTMYLPPDQVDARPDSSGIPIPGTELWIEDENGGRLGPGQVGELVVRGRNVMRGYWGAPDATALRFRPGPLPGERVCHSGDLFRTDEEGFFYFVGRKDDIIKCRGEKVAPREVENVLHAIPGVREAAVVGVPDPLMGQAVKAFVVASRRDLSAAAVIAHCKARLEEFMVPRMVEFLDELPKTPSGKLLRRALL